MAIFKNDGDDPEEGVEETTTASGDNVAPLLPLRDIVVFPHMVVPLFVGRARSIKALEHAVAGDRELLLSAQREAEKDEPGEEDVYRIGTLGSIIQLLRLPDGTVKILVEGKRRARIRGFTQSDPFFACEYETLDESEGSAVEVEALVRSVHAAFETYVKLNKKVPPEMLNTVAGISEPSRLADTIVAQLNLKIDERQHLLELVDANQRLEEVFGLMQAELEVLQVERKIRSRVKKQMERSQKEYYLNEQMRAIQKELGERDEFKNEIDAGAGPEGDPQAQDDVAHERRGDRGAQLHRLGPLAALGRVQGREEGRRRGRAGAGRGPLRPGEAQGAHPRVPGGADPGEAHEGPHPVPGGPPGRGQDLPRQVDRAGDGPRLRAHQPGRCARRGGDPRPPAHLHRGLAGQGHPEP
jgi:Lon protease-like protein